MPSSATATEQPRSPPIWRPPSCAGRSIPCGVSRRRGSIRPRRGTSSMRPTQRCGRTPSSRTSTCEPRAASTCPVSKARRRRLDRPRGRLLITWPTGVGKSWIACALGHKACRNGRSVIYHRVPRLFEALALAPRRRPLWPPAQDSRARSAPDLGRLGSVGAHRARAARSPRNPGRPPSTHFDDRHQPGSGRAMV